MLCQLLHSLTKKKLRLFHPFVSKSNYSNVDLLENSDSSTPLISLPVSAYRTRKGRIPNVVETKIKEYPKLKAPVLKNRERKAAGLPKITMLQKDKYIGPRTIFMDRLIATQDQSTNILHKTFYNDINSKSNPLPKIPQEVLRESPEMVKHILSLSMATKTDLYNARKEKIIKELQAHPNDTGTPEVIGKITFLYL